VAAMTRPAGKVSVNPRPETASAPAGFVSVKVSVVVAPAAMEPAPNALASVAAPKYCTDAVAPLNARPGEVAERFVPLLLYVPVVALTTSTLTVHGLAPEAMVPPASVTRLVPGL